MWYAWINVWDFDNIMVHRMIHDIDLLKDTAHLPRDVYTWQKFTTKLAYCSKTNKLASARAAVFWGDYNSSDRIWMKYDVSFGFFHIFSTFNTMNVVFPADNRTVGTYWVHPQLPVCYFGRNLTFFQGGTSLFVILTANCYSDSLFTGTMPFQKRLCHKHYIFMAWRNDRLTGHHHILCRLSIKKKEKFSPTQIHECLVSRPRNITNQSNEGVFSEKML